MKWAASFWATGTPLTPEAARGACTQQESLDGWQGVSGRGACATRTESASSGGTLSLLPSLAGSADV